MNKKEIKKKQNKKTLFVTAKEHAQWHKENGSCGSSKEHEAYMKKYNIKIKK